MSILLLCTKVFCKKIYWQFLHDGHIKLGLFLIYWLCVLAVTRDINQSYLTIVPSYIVISLRYVPINNQCARQTYF